ncbi:MAG TPA: YtxH domain-containing protein [Candidatus Polarisedimenticolia bacterium]|nr:YtxH domain-containing protein [Candidatus Polarisedimenticolia bacterium]
MTENGNGSGILTGLCVGAVLGAVVGAGVALLYAPCSGKETRDLLARKTRKARETAAEALQHGLKTVRSEAEHIAGASGILPR